MQGNIKLDTKIRYRPGLLIPAAHTPFPSCQGIRGKELVTTKKDVGAEQLTEQESNILDNQRDLQP